MKIKIPFTNFAFQINNVKVETPGDRKGFIFGHGLNTTADRDLSNYRIGFEALFSAYRNNADVSGCVREYRENIGAAGYQWVNLEDPENSVADSITDELNSLLTTRSTWRKLKNQMITHLGVTGNAYWEKVKDGNKKVIGFDPIDPRTISIVSDQHGTVHKYLQKFRNKTIEFAADEIIHFMLEVDPINELFGMSPLEPAIWEVRTDASAMLTNFFFFQNDALPAVQYILDDQLSEEELKKAEKFIQDKFKGVKNSNKSAVLAGVKEIKTLGVSQKDMDFLNGRKFTTEKVCAAYGVPKFMLGYTESINNNNGIELSKKAHESTFKPLEKLISETITREIIDVNENLKGKVAFEFKTRLFEEESAVEKRALEEKRNGAITLRQYKLKTQQEITAEDEAQPNFNAYIIHQGSGALLLEDVGVSPVVDPNDPQSNENFIKQLDEISNRLKDDEKK